MAYFAELDENNIVVNIISVHNNELLDNGAESEEKGIAFCNSIKQSRWIKTSFNGTIRKHYAGIGFYYNEEADVFVQPQPFASWTLNDNFDWVSPVPKPDGNFYWDEDEMNWISNG